MKILNLKKEAEFKSGETYSICLRGARRGEISTPSDLEICTPSTKENPKLANIKSQNQYRFSDLKDSDCVDNYDESARTLTGLHRAMKNAYDAFGDPFEEREIVTILRFIML